MLFRKKYQSLNRIEISVSRLRANYTYLSHLSDQKIAPVLKSNAYGHGISLVAKILDTVGAPFFCVDSLYEAYELSKISIRTPILIMGYTHSENLKMKELPFSFAVYDNATLEVLAKYQPNARIHLFIDTGMQREGISLAALPAFLRYCKSFDSLKIEGILSHFGASDRYDDPLTQQQIKNFTSAQKIFNHYGIYPRWIHTGNSSALLHHKNYGKKLGNLVRAGLDIYGIDPEGKSLILKPALRVLTTLCQIKIVRKGERIGYDFTYIAKRNMTVGLLPYGYFDGLDRRLSNKGFVSIDGVTCPIIGRISMNMATIDVSKIANPHVGQEVVVYSDNRKAINSVDNASQCARTIPYDLLVHLTSSTKRIIVE